MAEPRMNAGVLRRKKKVLGELHHEFEKKLAVFAQQVNTKMETTSAEVASRSFEIAFVFLTQAFPNIENTEQAYMESEEGRLDFDAKLKEMEAKLEAKFEDRLREIGKRQEQSEADLLKEQVKFDDDLGQCNIESKRNMKEDLQSKTKRDEHLNPLYEGCSSNKKSKTTASAQQMPTATASTSSSKVTTTTTSTSASTVQSFGASAAAATLSGTPLSLSQTSRFKLLSKNDEPLYIRDVKFVSSSLLLVAFENCVKLFNIEGQELDTLKCKREPLSLATLTEKAPNCWSVAVAFHSSIGLLEVNYHTLSMKSVIKTRRHCQKIAAVSSTTLAASYSGGGMDLIDISGNSLCSISSNMIPWCMVTTEDLCLIVINDNTFYKYNLQQETQDIERESEFYKYNLQQETHDIKREISEIGIPESIACLQSDCCVVAERCENALHLVGHDGQYKRILWVLRYDGDDDDKCDDLRCVTINNNVCVCCTYEGSVYVLNVEGDQIE